MNCYSIRHLTRYRYSQPVSESIMETRMHPRSDSNQHCLTFSLSVSPRCRVFTYRDHFGNNVHHFDIPGEHNQLVIVAESVVEQQPMPDVPGFLSPDAWQALDAMIEAGDYWEMLLPSEFRRGNPGAHPAGKPQMEVTRRDDPLMLVQELNQRLFDYFEYVPRSTRVDSPIDDAILSGKGVCQDFAHTMIALLRASSAFRPATSPAISIAAAKTTTAPPPTPPTPGSTCCCRTLAGSALTPPTTSSPIIATSAPRSAATMPTSPPPTASSAAKLRASSMSPCTLKPATSPPSARSQDAHP